MQFNKKGMLRQRYIGPFEALKEIGSIAYRMALSPSMSRVHPIFNVSMPIKYHRDSDYIMHWDPKHFDKELCYEDEFISIQAKNVMELRIQVIPYGKLQ